MTVKHWNTGVSAERYRKKKRASKQADKKFKFHYQAIGDCFYDMYCQPEHTNKEVLLKDMARILNGELKPEDIQTSIEEWIAERNDWLNCYLDKKGEIIVPIK